jgi:hypothetical protein
MEDGLAVTFLDPWKRPLAIFRATLPDAIERIREFLTEREAAGEGGSILFSHANVFSPETPHGDT